MEKEFLDIDKRNGWNLLFQEIRNESCNFSYIIKEAKKVENKSLNRYRDVNPFDHSRVCLKRGDKDYINASLVNVPAAERSYILTQGPLPVTTGHFWLMVWEQKSKGILMLNRIIEKNSVKCHQYWPIGSVNGGSDDLFLTDVGLKVTFLNQSYESYYIIRKFLLTDFESQENESREIIQFHYTTWPDFGVPQSPGAFLNFLFSIRNSGVLENNVGPAVVHCSAGIGRSGTFCLVDSCLVLIEKNDPNSINVRQQLLDMRHFRMGLIQTPDQLRFSYVAIIEGSKMLLSNRPLQNMLRENENERKTCNINALNSKNASIDEIRTTDIIPPLPPRLLRNSDDFLNSGDNCITGILEKVEDNGNIEVCASKTNEKGDIIETHAYSEDTCSQSTESGKKTLLNTEIENKASSSQIPAISENSELRKRARKEREEKTAAKVQNIKKKQKESERWENRRSKKQRRN
ncbi:hypothetical protein JTE90_021515 [Oedothorax gibbosus]|uniref:protein-tyrosine-phosphatase n=1 Tax=Oedothorax gibbosus TaxID=931172 RepID=A0AAV6VR83_9ARAC|nr:hypothetical protein JTE90_021515 [Oedothorax gibbosus]